MGLYTKYVLPRIIDLAMGNKETTRLRAEWIPHVHGDILEIGIGSGLNLPFYSSNVHHIYGIDPSLELQQMARRKHVGEPIQVEFFSQSAEEMLSFPNASIDTVIT